MEKYLEQIKELHDQGYSFEYGIDHDVVGKWMVPITNLSKIIDNLKEGEKLIFLPNIFAEESIYWTVFEIDNSTTRCVRIDSSMGSIKKYYEELYLSYINENKRS